MQRDRQQLQRKRLQGKNTLLEIIIEVEYFQAGEGGRASTYWIIINVT